MREIRVIVERNAFIADDFFDRGALFRLLHYVSFADRRGAAVIVERPLDLDAPVFRPEAQVIIELRSVQAWIEAASPTPPPCAQNARSAEY